jgi:RNA polymerase sigma factor (sigma-70 family)
VNDRDVLAERFEENRAHLQGVAYRMLGSLSEADDAVQEAWLRLSRSHTSEVENLRGWLTTVVARVCLDFLRSHKARREESLDENREGSIDPESEALLAESVGLALLVVLETLAPAERLAFVLHDMFDVPFEEIGPIVGRSPTAARQLASRARRRGRSGARGTGPRARSPSRGASSSHRPRWWTARSGSSWLRAASCSGSSRSRSRAGRSRGSTSSPTPYSSASSTSRSFRAPQNRGGVDAGPSLAPPDGSRWRCRYRPKPCRPSGREISGAPV